MVLIPFNSDDPAYAIEVQLGENSYTFDVMWNERAGFWTFDLTRMSDAVLLARGVPILLGQDLLAPYALDMGTLFAYDAGEKKQDADSDDLGVRVFVAWMTTEEVEALA